MSARAIELPGHPRPRGYANGMAARGEVLAIAGQIGWDAAQRLVDAAFVPQFQQALTNVVAVLTTAGGQTTDLISLTIYVTDKRDYIAHAKTIGEIWRALLGRHYPAMALIEVSGLLEPQACVEIAGLAVLPDCA